MFQCFLIGTFFYRKNQALIYCLDDAGNTFYPKGERRYFMIDYVKRGQNMARLRKSQGLSVEKAALKAPMSETWWKALEAGCTAIDTMRRIAYALNVDPLVLDIFPLSDEEIRTMAAAFPDAPPQVTSKVHLGSNIVWLRKQRKMTQKELAKLSHISQAWLREIEHDCANATITPLRRIAAALDVSLFTLYALTVPLEDILNMVHAARKLAGMVPA